MAASPRSGTGFVNFDSFLGANQGAIDRTRSAMTDPVRQRLKNADTDRLMGKEDADRLAQASTLAYDPTHSEAEMLALGGATYGGPNSAMDNENFNIGYGNAFAGNNDAQRQANIYGRAGALRDQFGTNSSTYTAGNQMFDSALLGAKGGRTAYDANAKAGGHLLDAFKADIGSTSKAYGDARQATRDAASTYGATGAQMRDTRVANERNAAQTKQEAEAWQNSPWAKRIHGKPTKDARFNPGNFNAGAGGGWTP